MKNCSYRLLILVVLFCMSISLFIYNGINYSQYYDSLLYSQLSQKFGEFFSRQIYYPDTFRGYLFPWLICLFNKILPLNLAVIAINVILVTLLSFWVAPNLSSILFGNNNAENKCLFSISIFVVIICFWFGYFKYALSDFPAIFCLFSAMIICLRNKNITYFLSGILLASALNIRPIYQINLFVFFVYFVYLFVIKKVKLRNVFAFLLGVSIVLLPQVVINHNYNPSTYSPFVQTNQTFGNNLYLKQLYWGIKIQKYETFIGDKNQYPEPGVKFDDNEGINLAKNKLDNSPESIKNFVYFVINNKAFYVKMLARHFFNGIDIKYNTPYVHNLIVSHIFSCVNYFIFALAFCFLFMTKKVMTPVTKSDNISMVFVYANILVPIILIIPTAIEVRFCLPLFILIYISAVHFILFHKLLVTTKSNTFIVLFIILFMFIGFYLSYNTYNSMHGNFKTSFPLL
jgi:hypothetical protein